MDTDFENYLNSLQGVTDGKQALEQVEEAKSHAQEMKDDALAGVQEALSAPLLHDPLKAGVEFGVSKAKSIANDGLSSLKNTLYDKVGEYTGQDMKLFRGLQKISGENDTPQDVLTKYRNLRDPETFAEKWRARGEKYNNMTDEEIEERRQIGIKNIRNKMNKDGDNDDVFNEGEAGGEADNTDGITGFLSGFKSKLSDIFDNITGKAKSMVPNDISDIGENIGSKLTDQLQPGYRVLADVTSKAKNIQAGFTSRTQQDIMDKDMESIDERPSLELEDDEEQQQEQQDQNTQQQEQQDQTQHEQTNEEEHEQTNEDNQLKKNKV